MLADAREGVRADLARVGKERLVTDWHLERLKILLLAAGAHATLAAADFQRRALTQEGET